MRKLHVRSALFVFAACVTCLSQQPRLAAPRPVRLRITVTYDGQTRVRDATVELQDGLGFGTAMNQKVTDQDGRVEFNTTTGVHRLRISGADFYPFEGELEITPVEDFHAETFQVKRKTDAEATPQPEQSVVPAIRLKIPDNAHKEFEKEASRWRITIGRTAVNTSRRLLISTRSTTWHITDLGSPARR